MKFKHFLLPLCFAVIFSCTKESNSVDQVQNNEEEEEEIIPPPPNLLLTEVYTNHVIWNEEIIYSFNNDTLTTCNASVAAYENGLLSKLDQEDLLEHFDYDDQGRLTRYSGFDGSDLLTRTITYEENEINVQEDLVTPFDAEQVNIKFFLDSAKQIIKEEFTNQFNEVSTSTINYDQNGNIISVSTDDSFTAQTIVYEEDPVSSSYQFYRLLFGTHWKNNTILFKGNVRSMINSRLFAELANNYPSETIITFFTGIQLSLGYTYEFDDNFYLTQRLEHNIDGELDTSTNYQFE